MSTDPIGVAFGRDDTAFEARAPQNAADSSNELTGIATAIERVEALLAACGPAPESTDAVERIADIAFVLHERDVEASLCDALDAAVRELGNANTVKQANVQHVRQAAELLRDLSLRVADMIALLQVSPSSADDAAAADAAPHEQALAPAEQQVSEDASEGEILDGEIPREGLFGAELLEDDEFARAVAELAASLPALAEPVEPVVVALHEPADLEAKDTAPAPELEETVTEAQHETVDLAADKPAPVPEAKEAIAETPHEAVNFAEDETAGTVAEEEEAAEARREPADPAAGEFVLAPEPDEAIAEVQCEPADVAAEEAALEAEQQLPIDNAADTIEQAPSEEPATIDLADEQLSHDVLAASYPPPEEPKIDEAISDATLLSEGTPSETLSREAKLESTDLPGNSSDDSLPSVDATVSRTGADVVLAHTASTLPPEQAPESEIALVPDESPAAVPKAEPELTPGDARSAPADVAGSVAEQPSDQITACHDGGNGPMQIAGESNAHDTDGAVIETATDVNKEPAAPPRVNESSQSLLPELALVDPQDDPGDLFEPLPDAAPAIVVGNLSGRQRASKISASAATMRTHFAAASDPLAAMRALSAEELLALFT
jgi:hypothetical protein